ncbi:MAG TPA: glycosyl hydrolase 53 family protein [Paenibacillus sp.]
MKKSGILLLVFLLAFSSFSFANVPLSAAADLPQESSQGKLQNPGFESGDLSGWTVTQTVTENTYEINSLSPHTGSYSFNYWNDNGPIEFKLSQVISGLEDGTYELRAWASGGGGETRLKLYAETEDSDLVVLSTDIVNTGWEKWTQYSVQNIEVVNGAITIGFDVSAPTGTWGYFDDVELIKMEEDSYNPADFIKGVDISTLQALEDKGVAFYDNGVKKDLLTILKDHGVNYVRLRLWNDPVEADGYNDKSHTVAMAQRVKAAGMKLLLDFHYSDFWADPGQQVKPKAWKDLDFNDLKQAVYAYTHEVLSELTALDAYPDMIQIGNEINSGMLHPDGSTSNFDQLAELLKQGSLAVRDTVPQDHEVKIMLHLAEGGSNGKFRSFFDQIQKRGVDYDVIGLSYYPYWHGTFQDLKSNMNDLVARYGKEVVVAETAYPYTYEDADGHGNIAGENETKIAGFPASVENQKLVTETVMNTVAHVDGHRGLGVFYWEPAWLPGVGWKSGEGNAWENQAMFDFNGNALESLNAFQFTPGSISDILPLLVYPSQGITIAKGGVPALPATANVLFNEGSIRSVPVVWDEIASGQLSKPGKFTLYGTVEGISQRASVEITVLAQANEIKNPGFETGNLSDWTLTGTSDVGKAEHNTANAHSGSYAFNYWYGEPYKYQLTQELSGLKNGVYTLKAWASGGGGDTVLKLFAKQGEEEVLSTDMINTGWNLWKQYSVENIKITNGRITVGFEVEAPGGVWGYFDDVELIRTADIPEPGTPGNPDTPSTPGTTTGNSSSTGSSGSGGNKDQKPESASSISITSDQLKKTEEGSYSVTISTDVHEVTLSSDIVKLLGSDSLELTNGVISLLIPSDVLLALFDLDANASNSTITVQINPMNRTDVEAIVRQADYGANSNINVLTEGYDVNLTLKTSDGVVKRLSQFLTPLTIRLKLDLKADRNIAGIFDVANGRFAYVGGKWSDDMISADIYHSGTYTTLQIAKSFADVSDDHWAQQIIAELAAKQIVEGDGNGSFHPNRSISRAEFTALLVRALDIAMQDRTLNDGVGVGLGDGLFNDVPAQAWYADAVSVAYQYGIVNGKGNGQFDPQASLTREEMAVMLMKAYTLFGESMPQQEMDNPFADDGDISAWAAEFVASAVKLGLLQGRDKGKFSPSADLTRAEAAQVIYRLLQL